MTSDNEEVRSKLLKDVEMAIISNFSTRLKELLDTIQFQRCSLPQKRKIISQVLMLKWIHCHGEPTYNAARLKGQYEAIQAFEDTLSDLEVEANKNFSEWERRKRESPDLKTWKGIAIKFEEHFVIPFLQGE